ncbi:MAG: iron ABC transporter permease [Tannerellaceae bacterium]|nr:iron ABC transporter permease [Tannerellaceae bacterium]
MRAGLCTILGLALLLLFASSLVYGAVYIPFDSVVKILSGKEIERIAWQSIVIQSRLPQAATAALAGSSLAVSGLLLQTFFRNPLAGPSILGISDGANLGVAAVILLTGNSGQYFLGRYMTVIPAAFAGATAVMALILYFSSKVRNSVMLLIIGIMIGYLASSAISVLNYYATADRVHSYVMWGMGNFSSVSLGQLPLFAACAIAGLVFSVLLIKPLNALLLGETYAANLGVRVPRVRMLILLCTGFLAAVTTAFCGPVSFIGLAVPHVARLALRSSDHRRLLPVTLLAGACVALLCNMLMVVPGSGTVLPLNAVTPLIGAPIIIYVIASKKHIHYFNEG